MRHGAWPARSRKSVEPDNSPLTEQPSPSKLVFRSKYTPCDCIESFIRLRIIEAPQMQGQTTGLALSITSPVSQSPVLAPCREPSTATQLAG